MQATPVMIERAVFPLAVTQQPLRLLQRIHCLLKVDFQPLPVRFVMNLLPLKPGIDQGFHFERRGEATIRARRLCDTGQQLAA
ncbi:hypothetical protein D3C81_1558220 [compost metagenome]